MKKLILIVGILAFTGCSGVITKHQYTLDDVEKAEKVYTKVKEAYLKNKGATIK